MERFKSMKIEFKPNDFYRPATPYPESESINSWSARQANKIVEPINKMLEGAVTVYGKSTTMLWSNHSTHLHTETALLINIEPIKKDTHESVLRELVSRWDKRKQNLDVNFDGIYELAKKVLGEA